MLRPNLLLVFHYFYTYTFILHNKFFKTLIIYLIIIKYYFREFPDHFAMYSSNGIMHVSMECKPNTCIY